MVSLPVPAWAPSARTAATTHKAVTTTARMPEVLQRTGAPRPTRGGASRAFRVIHTRVRIMQRVRAYNAPPGDGEEKHADDTDLDRRGRHRAGECDTLGAGAAERNRLAHLRGEDGSRSGLPRHVRQSLL